MNSFKILSVREPVILEGFLESLWKATFPRSSLSRGRAHVPLLLAGHLIMLRSVVLRTSAPVARQFGGAGVRQVQRPLQRVACRRLATEVQEVVNPIQTNAPSVKYWMAGGAALVYGIVMVGGITRLTDSGLSMVDWKLQGGLPPRGDEEWAQEFEKYKLFPEFKRLFPSMTLEEFKDIYFWEYLHRMWGRAIGLYVGLPVIYYAATRKIQGPLLRRCALLTAGVGFQGLIGWWMVKSGLQEPTGKSDQPRVSQYRLATHLGSALVLYTGMFWTAMDLFRPQRASLPAAVLSQAPSHLMRNLHFYRRSIAATTALSGSNCF